MADLPEYLTLSQKWRVSCVCLLRTISLVEWNLPFVLKLRKRSGWRSAWGKNQILSVCYSKSHRTQCTSSKLQRSNFNVHDRLTVINIYIKTDGMIRARSLRSISSSRLLYNFPLWWLLEGFNGHCAFQSLQFEGVTCGKEMKIINYLKIVSMWGWEIKLDQALKDTNAKDILWWMASLSSCSWANFFWPICLVTFLDSVRFQQQWHGRIASLCYPHVIAW